jgi:hypothetical protein
MHLLLNKYNKIFYKGVTDYTDYTDQMRKWSSETMTVPLYLAQDFIYIGCPHSFASRFFVVDTVNAVTGRLTIEYYYGRNSWRAVKNLIDETSVNGVPFARSGFMTWDLPDDWIKTAINSYPETTYNETQADGLGLYWIRIKSSQTLTITTKLKWLGLIWTDQSYMKIKWPDVDNSRYLPTGKTDWFEMIELSTGDVADDLNIQNIIDYELQAKDIEELSKLTALKTMVNILIPMRSSETLSEMRKDFEAQYSALLKKRLKAIDTDGNETIDKKESLPFDNLRLIRY